jgi:hypothetical protein
MWFKRNKSDSIQIRTIQLGPEDIIVLRHSGCISEMATLHLRENMAKHFPGHKCLILEDGMQLDVLHPEKAKVNDVR